MKEMLKVDQKVGTQDGKIRGGLPNQGGKRRKKDVTVAGNRQGRSPV